MDVTRTFPQGVLGSYYKFGSNHLRIGEALQDLLTFLEERYDISFDELEEKKRTGKRRKTTKNKSD
jgi:hypothetical protein